MTAFFKLVLLVFLGVYDLAHAAPAPSPCPSPMSGREQHDYTAQYGDYADLHIHADMARLSVDKDERNYDSGFQSPRLRSMRRAFDGSQTSRAHAFQDAATLSGARTSRFSQPQDAATQSGSHTSRLRMPSGLMAGETLHRPPQARRREGGQNEYLRQATSRRPPLAGESSSRQQSSALDKLHRIRAQLGRSSDSRGHERHPESQHSEQSSRQLVPLSADYAYPTMYDQDYAQDSDSTTIEEQPNQDWSIVPSADYGAQTEHFHQGDDFITLKLSEEDGLTHEMENTSSRRKGVHRSGKSHRSSKKKAKEESVEQQHESSVWPSMQDEQQQYQLMEIASRRRGLFYSEIVEVFAASLTELLRSALLSKRIATVELALTTLFPNHTGRPLWIDAFTDEESDTLVSRFAEVSHQGRDTIRNLFMEVKLTPQKAHKLMKLSRKSVLRVYQSYVFELNRKIARERTLRKKQKRMASAAASHAIEEEEDTSAKFQHYPWENGLGDIDKDEVIHLVMLTCDVDEDTALQKLRQDHIEAGFGMHLLGSEFENFMKFIHFMNTKVFPE
ncbi:hypothetical protein CBS101457_000242 [Exobasidium rhododendri]|nr:hypothetical protein CBS101457_000242 [Exobasidium rhododendri]